VEQSRQKREPHPLGLEGACWRIYVAGSEWTAQVDTWCISEARQSYALSDRGTGLESLLGFLSGLYRTSCVIAEPPTSSSKDTPSGTQQAT
jgi:hypothetical protein